LKAALAVSRTVDGGSEVLLRITLQNTSSERQSFHLEVPSAAFVVRGAAGGGRFVIPESCTRLSTCPAPALARLVTLAPGEEREFVEHWNLTARCVPPGWYTVSARLRAYQQVRPDGTVDAGAFEPFTLQADLWLGPDASGGRCVAAAPRVPALEADCPTGGGRLAPVFFEVDQAALTAQARARLEVDARCIQRRGFAKVVVEGNCDERGPAGRNLSLGLRRAETVREYLIRLGVDAAAIRSVSLSEEHPVCTEQAEGCWRMNRRADVLAE
jgi:peptidoglycan-associated lipoprotein